MKHLVFTILLVSSITAFSQEQDLNNALQKLQQTVVTVQTASKTFEPKVSSSQPGVISYGFDEIDSKGARTNYVYEFNLSDIDPYAIREQTQKDIILTICAIKNKQKMVKVYKNNEVQSYDDQVAIHATNIENARAISDIIKKSIAPAEKFMAGRLKLTGYDAMVSWLTSNIKSVNLGTKSYTQTMVKGDKPGTFKLSQIEADSKSSSEENYLFNLSDLNANSITFKVTGNKFAINFETLAKAKYIATRKNGEVKSYTNEITINTNNVDEARDIRAVLAMAIPLAVEKVKADMPVASTEKDALQSLKSLITEISIGQKQYIQSFEAQCITNFSQTEKDSKSSTTNVYKFNVMDINPASSKIDVTGDKMFIELNINDGKKLMMLSKNDKFEGYEKDAKVYMPDIENARRAKYALDKAIEKCKASYKEPFASDLTSMTSWIKENLKDATIDGITISQKLENVEEGNKNKYKLTQRELNPKGTGAEEVYEFNLSDINPLSIDVDVKGKWLYVTLETEFKGKVIKYYKDGKIQPYTNKMQLAVNDVDLSRSFISALKKSIKEVKSN